jgi:hypothetical protein
MVDRLLRVNAYTTLDVVDAEATGHDFAETAVAVLDVTAPREDPDEVTLALELDNTDLAHLPAHADRVRLTPDQARAVASDLERHAARVEAARAERGGEAADDGGDGGDEGDDPGAGPGGGDG